jgi:elongation factor G
MACPWALVRYGRRILGGATRRRQLRYLGDPLGGTKMAHGTAQIRNLALVGHTGAGKTLLTEALLAKAGAIRTMGDLARGTTVSDFDPMEKEHRHSLDVSVCNLAHQGRTVHIIDTPGYPDLLGRAAGPLAAVETAVIVVSATDGIELGTRRMMQLAADRGLDRVVVVNKIDAPGADLPGLLAALQAEFGREVLPVNLPIAGGGKVLDCFFTAEGPTTPLGSVNDAHRAIIEQVVEVDEALMTRYLDGAAGITAEMLHDPFEKALREAHVVPVCFTSATSGAGIAELLDLIARLFPNPTEANPPPFVKGEGAAAERVEVKPDPALHVLAHCFKVTIDPYVGKLGLLRVHQGTLKANQALFVGDGRKPVKPAHLYRMQGKDHVEVAVALPGNIVAVPKVEELFVDAVLHDSHDEDHHHLPRVGEHPAMLGQALEPARRGDEQKLADALHKLLLEDPSLRLEHDQTLGEAVLYGLGELHLRIVLERLKRQHNCEVKTHPPRIPYRETIARPAEGHHRHKKQTGGAGQFGEVFLRIEPRARGEGFEFVDAVKGGAISAQFISSVEKGVRQALSEGALAGYPLHDLKVTVHDGKMHSVDSKDVAFQTAGRKALLDAVAKAGPLVLEPIVSLAIEAPSPSVGAITGDLTSLRGRITRQDAGRDGRLVIEAQAPLAELAGYAQRLKSLTSGEGSYAMQLSHYEPVPPRVQAELAATWQKHRRHEDD